MCSSDLLKAQRTVCAFCIESDACKVVRVVSHDETLVPDDLRKLDDENVYRKLQGHWIIEMSEMMATANAKSIEEIKSFLSRQKEVYKLSLIHI